MSIDLINHIFMTGIKCSILSVVVIVLVGRSRNSSARLLHSVLMFSLFCVFLLPLVSVYAPSLVVPVLPQVFSPLLYVPVMLEDSIGRLILLCASVWLVVALLLLCRLTMHVWQAYRLAYRGESVCAGYVVDLVQTLSHSLGIRRHVSLRCSTEVATPLTLGSVSPLIVLPAEYVSWSQPRLRRFLLHELAHIQRLDWLQKIGGQAIVALLWFLPCAWWLLNRAQWYAELACDDAVIAKGARENDRHEYAQDLLALGESLRPVNGCVALIDGSVHYQRIDALLDSSRVRSDPGRNRWLYAGTIFLLPLGLATMKLGIKTPLFVHFQPAVTVVSLTVGDLAAHAGCGDHCIVLADRPSRQWLQPSVQPTTEWYSRQPSAVDSPALATIDIAPVQVSVEPPATLAQPLQLVRTFSVEPKYPLRALRQNIEGRVRVRFDVYADGTTGNIEVVQRESKQVFDSAVIAAVQEFRYQPFSRSTTEATASITETFEFRIVEDAKTKAD